MSLSPATLSTEAKASNQEDSDSPRQQEADGEKSEHHDSNCNRDDDENEYGEDEEEDVDFNPLLKETVSLDASSSLSSEVDVLDADVVESGEDPSESSRACCGKGFTSFLQDRPVGDKELGVEVVMQNRASSVPDIDNGDAICKRTRARYSLASFTMDELETFLQETDDEDDLQNGDDEEEYKKFLAAVLHGGDGVSVNIQVNENVDDDEDEDNDADFELEIEEALESDLDEHLKVDDIEEEYKVASLRPKTRQTRWQRATIPNKKISGLSNRPLRPLLPYLPNSLHSLHGAKSLMLRCSPAPLSPLPANGGFVNGFTPYQIGQLHCLIHEHVQLLIQVFSVCVLKPARRHIASDVRELISQMLHKRDQVLVNRRVPYPNFCFFSPYVHPSVSLKTSPAEIRFTIPSQPFNRTNGFTNNQGGCPVGSWVPYISGPILSVLDVAPLRLVKEFMDDISHAVQVYQRRQIGGMNHICSGMKPLFPMQNTHLTAEPDGHAVSYSNVGFPSSSSVRPSKKTMAAVLVEKAKEQAVSLVPEEISELAQRFYPLFNPALYPHKPTAAAAANRVLFTDAEDGLLALGMLEYNTDWKAIQQRYLPCKSKHQIFVRQKNRASSKAPENPIKAVRRMKNSPLTVEEISRIEEGLRVFKLDWISVWKLIVPYRDPSLLPRLWRIATGTQKSYKKDATKNSKRRLHESDRRKSKGAALDTCHTSYDKEDDVADNAVEENNGADNSTYRVEDSYVHEAFFADWRPPVSSTQVTHDGAQKTSHYQLLGEENSQVARQMNHNCSRNDQSQISNESARKFNNWQVVKLAPGLPPVNLPPSVRVISQSAFKSYEGGTYPRTLGGGACTNDSVRDSAVPKTAGAANPDTNYYAEDCNKSNQNLEETSQNVREGKDESGVQIHPLFFRAPEDGHYKSKSTSSSFNFFSGSQPQLNLSLFHHSQQTAQTVDFLDSSCNLRDNTSISPGFEFHPLLQRSDNANCSLEAASLPSCTSESSRGRCIWVQNAIPSNATSRLIGKNNEVDLEMHLSSMGRSVTSAGDQNPPNCETPNRTTQQHDSMSDEENGNDLAEIVMEQEELSDSEEEIGESVEFECEEMEDSEGEEILESEQEMDKVSLDESCDQSVPDRANSCSISADHTARLDSDDKATDEQGSSLCLNLNSSGLVSPQVESKSRHSNGSGKARKSAKNSRLDRKRQKSASDVPGQANQCSVVSANKKSRKRHRRTDSRKTDTSSTADMVTDCPKRSKKDEVG